jgi:hypothetical protein
MFDLRSWKIELSPADCVLVPVLTLPGAALISGCSKAVIADWLFRRPGFHIVPKGNISL